MKYVISLLLFYAFYAFDSSADDDWVEVKDASLLNKSWVEKAKNDVHSIDPAFFDHYDPSVVIKPYQAKYPVTFQQAIQDYINFSTEKNELTSILSSLDQEIGDKKNESHLKNLRKERKQVVSKLQLLDEKIELSRTTIKYYKEELRKPKTLEAIKKYKAAQQSCLPNPQQHLGAHPSKIKTLFSFFRSKIMGKALLIEAVESGSWAQVISMINQGADLEEVNSAGNTALMVAILKGNAKMVEFLLGSGAKFNTKNKGGLTALDLASNAPSEKRLLTLFTERLRETPPTFSLEFARKDVPLESRKSVINDLPRSLNARIIDSKDHDRPTHGQDALRYLEKYNQDFTKQLEGKPTKINENEQALNPEQRQAQVVNDVIDAILPAFNGDRQLATHCLSLFSGNTIGSATSSLVGNGQFTTAPVESTYFPTLDLNTKKLTLLSAIELRSNDPKVPHPKGKFGVIRFEINCESVSASRRATLHFYPLSEAVKNPEFVEDTQTYFAPSGRHALPEY